MNFARQISANSCDFSFRSLYIINLSKCCRHKYNQSISRFFLNLIFGVFLLFSQTVCWNGFYVGISWHIIEYIFTLMLSGFLSSGNLCLIHYLKLFPPHAASRASVKKCIGIISRCLANFPKQIRLCTSQYTTLHSILWLNFKLGPSTMAGLCAEMGVMMYIVCTQKCMLQTE